MLEQLQDPDAFGEACRDLIFNQVTEGESQYTYRKLGCYDTFELREGVKHFDPCLLTTKALQLLLGDGDIYMDELPRVHAARGTYNGVQVTAAWYWDGDGTLLVISGEKWAINDDCKKNYGWQWVE